MTALPILCAACTHSAAPRCRVVDNEILGRTDRKVAAWGLVADSELRLIHGKFPFGTHRHLRRAVRYAVVLGDPAKKVLQAFENVSKKEDHPLHSVAKECEFDPGRFFATEAAASLRNRQTRAIAGTMGKAIGADDPALLELARSNLVEHFDWAANESDLPAKVAKLGLLIGVELSVTGKPGVTAMDAPPGIERAIAFDMELCQHVRDVFN